jgi:predicted aspartyl protease
MPAYDASFNPPAPVAEVVLAHPVTGDDSGVLRGKLDTGADVTVIPERLLAHLNLTPKGEVWTRGYDGTYTLRPVYYVQMTVEGFLVASVRCIAAARSDVLLGRNILNRFFITLDGKRQTFSLTE